MKILFLLLSFFLLFLQGDAGERGRREIRGGNCRFGRCQFAERQIGRCSAFQPCCGSPVWG
uniref:Beta-defensin-like domain-containing protein n=1 Tax=Anas platyrhynchos platyrhynchos TaxID=8840 RepID=A0A493T764_ANAPP